MKSSKNIAERSCPRCGEYSMQINAGFQADGLQRCLCKNCGFKYTLFPKGKGYSDDIKNRALELHRNGVSARAIGRELNMSKSNILNWTKKASEPKLRGEND